MTIRIAVTAVAVLIAGAASAQTEYAGPKFDLSTIQPEFRIGFLGDESTQDTLTRNACLQPYAEAAFGVPVKMFTFKDYAGTMESLLGRNLDFADLGASAYAGIVIQDPEAVIAIGVPKQIDGSTGYYSVMVTKAESGIDSIEGMKGKRLGYADPNSTSGYLIPRIEIGAQVGDAANYFAETKFMGGHENGVLGVLNGDVDAAVTWTSMVGDQSQGWSNGNLRKMVDKGVLNMDDIRVIWHSTLIPNGPVVMPSTLPQEARDTGLGMYQWIAANDKECAGNIGAGELDTWVPVEPGFFDVVIAARKAEIESQKSN